MELVGCEDVEARSPTSFSSWVVHLKCPNCDSIGPLINLYPNIIDVQYTCEKCGCKYITKFQHGCICDVTPITEFK